LSSLYAASTLPFSFHRALCAEVIVDNMDSLKTHFSSPSFTGSGLTGIVTVTVVPFPAMLSIESFPP
jgi:hypothetical protein